MARLVRRLTVETLADVPAPCRSCVFWELTPVARASATEHDPEFEKEAWCSEVELTHGACGKVVYADGEPVGYALYGPPGVFPGADAFPAHVSRDALLLATLSVHAEREHFGLGKLLVQEALKDAKAAGKRALEAFGDRDWRHRGACIVPAAFLERVGFKVKRDHPRFPLLRIDVRSLALLADEAAAAVEAFLGSVFSPERAARPARFKG